MVAENIIDRGDKDLSSDELNISDIMAPLLDDMIVMNAEDEFYDTGSSENDDDDEDSDDLQSVGSVLIHLNSEGEVSIVEEGEVYIFQDTDDTPNTQRITNSVGTERRERTRRFMTEKAPVTDTDHYIDSEDSQLNKKYGKRALCHMGKKRARRMQNVRELEMLAGNDEYSEDPATCGSVFCFSQLVQNSALASKVCNALLDDLEGNHSEEEEKCSSKRRKKSEGGKKKSISAGFTAEQAFSNLTNAEKSLFKQRNAPLGMIQYLDEAVFAFFKENPAGMYISDPLSSFERMILHAVAHYYSLNSFSYNRARDSVRLTRVDNFCNSFCPKRTMLSNYLVSRETGGRCIAVKG